jgi:hypothetical protein
MDYSFNTIIYQYCTAIRSVSQQAAFSFHRSLLTYLIGTVVQAMEGFLEQPIQSASNASKIDALARA